jgi:hypothetical protein
MSTGLNHFIGYYITLNQQNSGKQMARSMVNYSNGICIWLYKTKIFGHKKTSSIAGFFNQRINLINHEYMITH